MAKPPKNQPQEAGSSQPPQRVGSTNAEVTYTFYGMRSRALAWRSQWFARSRSADEISLTKARDTAFGNKLKLIDGPARKSGWKAGYDPAGAGSPWYPLGPRNVNGRVKALAVHPTDPNTLYAGAASGGVWKSVDGGQTWDSLWDMSASIAARHGAGGPPWFRAPSANWWLTQPIPIVCGYAEMPVSSAQ